MKFSTIPSIATALFLLLPCTAPAQEDPEAVYGKFHRAAASGNLEEMAKYGPDARRAELATMSAAQKDANVKMLAAMMPRAFTLRSKLVNPDGRSARLIVSGQGESIVEGKPETLYGMIRMVMARGEWKVDESSWSNAQPGILARVQPAGSLSVDKAALKAAGKPQGAPVVGSTSATPPRKLGTAKPACVYKPVMTAEDMDNCR
ncbi:MAG: hypothetical protein AABM33_01430 [Pseudomonadota bacterium]